MQRSISDKQTVENNSEPIFNLHLQNSQLSWDYKIPSSTLSTRPNLLFTSLSGGPPRIYHHVCLLLNLSTPPSPTIARKNDIRPVTLSSARRYPRPLSPETQWTSMPAGETNKTHVAINRARSRGRRRAGNNGCLVAGQAVLQPETGKGYFQVRRGVQRVSSAVARSPGSSRVLGHRLIYCMSF